MKAEFMVFMAIPSFSLIQENRMRELVEALEAHDACKPFSDSSRRKRKKRKKRRLPRVPPHGGRRPCDHALQVPAVLQDLGASVADRCHGYRGSSRFSSAAVDSCTSSRNL